MKNFLIKLFLACVFVLSVYSVTAQVNMQTGAAQIDLNLFNIRDVKSGLGASVNLSYVDGNGINVDEIAPNIGTGWNLEAGGVITRTIIGQPDDQNWTGTIPNGVDVDFTYNNVYPSAFASGHLYSTIDDPVPGFASQHILLAKNTVSPNLVPPRQTTIDRQLDLFTFSFNGRKGEFYIGRDKSIIQVLDSKLKISFSQQDMTSLGVRTTINQFVITDENGVIYTFSDLELTTLINYSLDPYAGVTGYNVYDGNYTVPGNTAPTPYVPQYVSKWYLTSIKNPFTTDEVDFLYNTFNVDIHGARHLFNQTYGSSTQWSMNRERYIYTGKTISRINFPNHQSLAFSYNSLTRADLPGDYALDKISLISNYFGSDKTEYYYQFNFGYFFQNQIVAYNYSFSATQQSFSRLCLQSFQKFSADGSVNVPPTTFSYILSISNWIGIVPAQFSLNKDLWGYYSLSIGASIATYNDNVTVGQFTKPIDNTDRITENAAQLGLISKITYSTGGNMSFSYEQNKTSDSNIPNNLAPGVRVNAISIDDGSGNVKQITYKYINADGTSSGKGFEAPVNSSNKLVRVYKVSSDSYAALSYNEIFNSSMSSFIYATKAFHTPVNSDAFCEDLVWGIILDKIVQQLVYVFSPAYQDQNVTLQYYDNQNLMNPLPVMYSRVEEQEISNSVANGKTVYQMTSYDDYPKILSSFSIVPNSNFPLFTSQQRVAFWEYGLPKSIQYFDNTVNPANPIKEVINTYTPFVNTSSNDAFMSIAWDENTSAYTPFDFDQTTLPTSYITSVSYYPTSGRMQLASTVENTYDKNGNKFSKTTNYTYNPTNYQLNNTESYNTNNSNEKYGKSIYYPSDYDPSINLTSSLIAKNIYNLPVTTADYKKNGSSAAILTGASVNVFTQLSDGEIKIGQVYGFENSSPVPNSFVSNFSSTTSPSSYSYLALKKNINYDGSSGSLLSVTINGQTESYITSYSGRYNIAKAFSCAYSNIAYTGFEDINNGNWNYASASVINSASKTGVSSFQLSTSPSVTVTSQQTLTSSITYTVSLWLKNSSGTCTVNGTAVNQILSNTDGWTYCTINVSGVTSITVAGTGIIDELRLFPSGSQMSTYSYDLMKGKTSEADATGRITYNQYDGLGRLDVVLDQNKNIVKKYSYNYTGQQTNYAGTVFTNPTTSQSITRNNCGSGYTGGSVIYTLPANTYTSVISQQDLNNQVQNDMLTNGQTYANTNGSCTLNSSNVTISYTNSTSSAAYLTLTNTSTSAVYNFTLNGNVTTATAFTQAIPQGTYNAIFTSSVSGTHYFHICSYSASGVSSYSPSNIAISSSCNTVGIQ